MDKHYILFMTININRLPLYYRLIFQTYTIIIRLSKLRMERRLYLVRVA